MAALQVLACMAFAPLVHAQASAATGPTTELTARATYTLRS